MMRYEQQILDAYARLGFKPRDRQVEHIDRILVAFLDEGNRTVVLSAPTGTGKSIIGAVVAEVVHTIRYPGTDAGASFLAPRVRMAQLQVQRLDPEATKLLVGLVIDQPAPIRITVDSVEYALFIGEQELVRSTYAKTITLPARQTRRAALVHRREY